VIADPPFPFAVNATIICPFPEIVDVIVGAAGGVP
jgi:hypothetical protein